MNSCCKLCTLKPGENYTGQLKLKKKFQLLTVAMNILYNGHIGFVSHPVYLAISYSTVVLYIGIMKVWGFWPKIITPRPA